jgi:hypothetical protein
MEKGKRNHQMRTGCFIQHRIESAGKRADSVYDGIYCIVLRGLRFNVVILKVQAINGEKRDD